MEAYKYFAFISYKREDEKWAKWLQRKLEQFRLPSNLSNRADLPKSLRPIFRDTTELSSGLLEEELELALSNSKYLIVICSPSSSQSQWVGKEVEFFIKTRGIKRVIPFIVRGEIDANTPEKECYPRVLRELPADKELIGININEMGRDAAAIKVVARMLGVDFDSLWQRHQREEKKKSRRIVLASALLTIAALTIAGIMWQQSVALKKSNWKILERQARIVANQARGLLEDGNSYLAALIATESLPADLDNPDKPYSPELESVLRDAWFAPESMCLYADGMVARAVRFSPDGSFLAVGSRDGRIRLWNVDKGELLYVYDDYSGGHADNVPDFCFSHDGRLFMSVAPTGAIIIRDMQSGEPIRQIEPEDTPYAWHFIGAFFSADDKEIIAATVNGSVGRWNVETGEIIKTLIGPTRTSWIFVLSPSEKCCALGSLTTAISVFDLDTGKLLADCSTERLRTLFSPPVFVDDNRVMICNQYGRPLYLLDVRSNQLKIITSELLSTISQERWITFTDAFHTDSRDCLIVCGPNGKVDTLWSRHNASLTCMDVSLDGNRVVTGSSDMTLRIFGQVPPNRITDRAIHFSQPTEAFLAEYSRVRSSLGASIYGWYSPQSTYNRLEDYVMSEDGSYSATISMGRHRLTVWDNKEWSEVFHLDVIDDSYEELEARLEDGKEYNIAHWHTSTNQFDFPQRCLPSDNRSVYVFSPYGYVDEYSVTEKHVLNHFSAYGYVYQAAINMDGSVVAATGGYGKEAKAGPFVDSLLYIWNSHSEKPDLVLTCDEGYGRTTGIDFTPDNKCVLIAGADNSLHLYDVLTGEERIRWGSLPETPEVFCFLPDGNHFIAASSHGLGWLMEIGQDLPLQSYDFSHPGARTLTGLSISDNGKYILTYANTLWSNHVDYIDVWDLATGVKIQEFDLQNPVYVGFSKDSDEIMVVDEQAIVHYIAFPPLKQLLQEQRERFKDRPLSDSERRKYLFE